MATPKTPRKPAENPKPEIQVKTPETNPAEKDPRPAVEKAEAKEAITLNEPTADKTAPQPSPFEDAVVLDAPKPEPKPESKADPKPKPVSAETVRPTAPVTPPIVHKTGPGFVPLVLGGVIAAGLGFGLARYVVPEGWPVPGSSPLQTQLTQQADEIAALRTALQALPEDSSKAVLEEVATLRVTANTALETAEAAKAAMPEATAAEDITPRLAALEDRLAALETRPAANGAVDPAILSGLTTEIDSLRNGLADQKAAAEKLVSEAEAVRADAAEKAQAVLLQAALTKVEAAMLDGAPFVEPLTMLVDAGLSVPAILTDNAENGLPTQAALVEGFDEPARAALEQSLRGNMGSTWGDRVGSFLRSQTGARSLTPQEGDDPDAVLSRANAAVATGDLPTALTEISSLPDAAQTALANWVAQVNLRIDAKAATVDLATALSER